MTEPTATPDRDLITRLLAIVVPVLTQARDVIGAARRVPELEEQLAQARAEQANDTAGDLAALQPLADAIDAALGLAEPAAEQAPDVAPVTAIEDVPAVANGDLPADSTDGRTDAPTAE